MLSFPDKTKEQLLVDLQELQQQLNSLKASNQNEVSYRRQEEEDMRDNSEQLRVIFNQSPIAIELYDNSGVLYQVNPACLSLFGIADIEVIRGFSLFADPNLSEVHKEYLRAGKTVHYQGPFDFEKVKSYQLYPTSKEGIIWLDVIISPYGNHTDLVTGFLVQIQDYTDQKQTEEALRQSEDQFRNLYNDAPVGLYRTSPEGTILLANRAIFDMLGFFGFEELSLRNLEKSGFGPTYQRQQFVDQIEKLGEVKDLEANWIRRDGEIIFVRENARAVRDANGKTLFYDGSVEDISWRKRTEMALLETEKKYERIVTNLIDVVYSVDGDTGEYTFLSPAFEKLLGYTQVDIKEMGGRKAFLSKVLPQGKSDEHQERFVGLRSGSNDYVVTDEIWWRCKDGSLKCMADQWSPVYQDGRLVSTDGALRDITASKKTEEALNEALVRAESSDRLKTAFLNNISHEVRTPLNGILGFAELMEDPALTPENRTFYRDLLQVSSRRLLKTINSYMDISLIVSGNMNVNISSFNLSDLLEEEYTQYRDQIYAEGIDFKLNYSFQSGKVMVNSDRELIRKILDHLLENAVKFTEFGSITLGYSIIPGFVEIWVLDSGIGISEELQEQVFHSFLQADVSLSRKHEGSGLGLAIAKGLAELLGGKIGVKSKDGSGSTFWFTIPHQVADSGDSALENMENHQDETINPLILIVEDDPINIFLLETMLGKSKVTVWHVENGKLAVECCQNHPEISLVLMDLKMPDMDGFEATRRIKAIRKDLIIIAVTAFAMPGDKEQALDAGCDDYMSKPFSSTQLKDKLREFIRLTP